MPSGYQRFTYDSSDQDDSLEDIEEESCLVPQSESQDSREEPTAKATYIYTFRGTMGVVCDDIGIVEEVIADGQAEEKGLKEGQQIWKIGIRYPGRCLSLEFPQTVYRPFSNALAERVQSDVETGFDYNVQVRTLHTYTFKGKTGMTCGANGRVQKVSFDMQAYMIAGIKEGQQIVKIGALRYSTDVLALAENSGSEYEVTVSHDVEPVPKPVASEKEIEELVAWLNDITFWPFCHPIDTKVKNLCLEYAEAKNYLPMMIVAGPAFGLALNAMKIIWLVMFILPFVAYKFIDCPTENSYGQPPVWLEIVAIVPVITVLLWLESKILSYVLLVQMNVLQRLPYLYNHIDLRARPFIVWRTFTVAVGISTKMQLICNSLFVAKAMRAKFCEDSGFKIEKAWEQVWSQSILAKCRIPTMSFSAVVVIIGMLHFLELTYMLMLSIPIGEKEKKAENEFSLSRTISKLQDPNIVDDKVDYEMPESKQSARDYNYEYSTVLDVQQNHGSALMILCRAARLFPVTCLEFRYDKDKMLILRAQIASGGTQFGFRYLHHMAHMLSQGIHTLLMVGLLQCVMQLNLQLMLMSLTSTVMHVDHADGLIEVSLLCNFVVLLLKLEEAYEIRTVYKDVREAFAEIEEVTKEPENIAGKLPRYETVVSQQLEDPHLEKMLKTWRRIQCRYLALKICICLYLVGLLCAAIKYVGFHACPGRFLNMTGCVTFSYLGWFGFEM